MLELGILRVWNPLTYRAEVQLVGSLTTYLDNISVSRSIPSPAMAVGNFVLVAIPDGNPVVACVIATWPGGTSEPDIYDMIFTRGLLFPTYVGWPTLNTGSAGVTQRVGFAHLFTGTMAHSVANINATLAITLAVDSEPQFMYDFQVFSVLNTIIHITLGDTDDPTALGNYFGLEIHNDSIWVLSCDGVARTHISIGPRVVAFGVHTVRQRIAGGAVHTWIDGRFRGAKTDRIPPLGRGLPIFTNRLTNTAAAHQDLRVFAPRLAWRPPIT